MVLEEVVGGITVKYGGLVEFVNYNVEFNLFSLLRAVAFEPYLYESNVPKLDEELLSYLDEAKKEYPLYRYHLRDRERIMRIAYLIEKRRAGMKIYSEDIYGFGFWKPMRYFNEILAQSDGEEEYGYLVYEMNEEMVMLTTIESGVLNSAVAGERISLRKVHRYGSFIFPMYKELVASNHAWIYYSLDNVIEREYESALRSAVENAKGNYGPVPKEYLDDVKQYMNPRRDLMNELYLLSLYLGDDKERGEFWKYVIRKIRKLIHDNEFMGARDYEYAGEFRGGLLKDLKKVENALRRQRE